MKTLATLVIAGLAAAVSTFAGHACAQTPARLVPGGSEITFTSKQMGVPVTGRFKRFDAQVAFDPKKPEAGRIGVTIELASVALGGPQFEEELAKPGWFDSGKVASASFTSRSIKATGASTFDVAGRLTIKGATRDLVVPVTLAPAGGANTVASGSFTVRRLDFRIGDGEWSDTSMVANDVAVQFKLVLSGLPAT